MLANQVLLKSISDMKGITGAEVSVWSMECECLFSTNEVQDNLGEVVARLLSIEDMYQEDMNEESIIEDGYHLRMVWDEESPCYILAFDGLQNDADVISALCANQLEHLIVAYRERLSKQSFLQNLLKGNLEEEDMLQKSERVHIKNNARRVVFVIEPMKHNEEMIAQTLKSLYVTGITDFIVEVEKTQIVFIKELSSTDKEKDIYHIAETIVDTLNMEAMVSVLVAYGTVGADLLGVERSYREAKIALEVGRSFEAKKTVLAYKQLGIGRLIHQLSDELCEEFLYEILGEEGLAQFDDDTMQAAYKFFENDLNISRTARALYVHRNTLSYRLEKIQIQTGLDVRVFEDAITFKLAIMVSHHVKFLQAKQNKQKSPN